MALEAVVFSQDHLFGCSSKDFYSLYDFCGLEENGLVLEDEMTSFNVSCSSMVLQDHNDCNVKVNGELAQVEVGSKRKRRQTKSYKNKEEVESQRMTHIAVERNRRKQMNEYFAVLRSLMLASYAQRGDQASIVGGAINFVKELEQLLQTLEAKKHNKNQTNCANAQPSPFTGFFTFPQYSSNDSEINNKHSKEISADIEVTMIKSHVNLKVQLRRRPKQLLRMVMGLQSLLLTTLHLNVTTSADQMVLYSFSLKVEDDCQFTSVDEIAAAVYQMVGRMQYENVCS